LQIKNPVMDISQLRKEYISQKLSEGNVNKCPILQFEKWLKEAIDIYSFDANAMMLSTVSLHGQPSSRIVLLKGYDQNGFVFFTNYNSKKGNDIEVNPKVCLSFFWNQLERQIHILGNAKKVSEQESDEYFASRPRESQIGAWASDQSLVIANRNVLENKYVEIEKLYINKVVPRPPYWGGYIVEPISIEFWQGRENRLHDRISYLKINKNEWAIGRLSP
jgi:pyridoxamine 5'-phosphate oxidase